MPSSKLLHSLRYLTDVRIRVGEAEGIEMTSLSKAELAVMDRAIEADIPADVCADQIIVARRDAADAEARVA